MFEKRFIKEVYEAPKVSIIIPTYNSEKYITKCLLSINNQTLEEIEIIIIDDGSTDKTLSIIEEFREVDSRIKTIIQKNKRQGAARNAGMKIANGEYIGFIDSDDWVDLNFFEELYKAAKKYDSDIALATNIRIGNGKTKKRLNITEEQFVTDLQNKIDISHQAKNPCPTNKIYRREFLEKNQIIWPEGVYCEDKLFTIQALYYANGLVTVPGINYYYFRNPTSTVKNKKLRHSKQMLENKNNARKAVVDFLKTQNATINDNDFWYIEKEIRILQIPIIRKKKYLKSDRIEILGFCIKKH